MYYNMRIKTLKRNTNNVIRMANDAMQVKAGHLSLNLNVLLRQRKDLSRILEEKVLLPSFDDVEAEAKYSNDKPEVIDSKQEANNVNNANSKDSSKEEDERKTTETKTDQEKITELKKEKQTSGESSTPSSPVRSNTHEENETPTTTTTNTATSSSSTYKIDTHERELFESVEMEKLMKIKLEQIDYAISEKSAKIRELHTLFLLTKRELNDVSEESIARLIIELETGGNIRLEDGKPSDVWYTSCEDLLLSRFFSTDFRAYNVNDLRVHRVTRIHNRFLRNRFDLNMEKISRKRKIRVASADSSGKRNLEYLFFGEDPRLNRMSGAGNELLRVPERGFRTAKEFRLLGMDESVTLSNSVSEAHLPSIRSFLSDSAIGTFQNIDKLKY